MAALAPRGAYITYADSTDYLRGAAVLSASLRAAGACAPLILMIPLSTTRFQRDAEAAIEAVAADHVILVSGITFGPMGVPTGAARAAERFTTCTVKLNVWDPKIYPTGSCPEVVCWLDADMIVSENLDPLFSEAAATLPRGSIAAAPGCTCNALGNARLPTNPGACPFNSAENTYINSGLFLARPDTETYQEVLNWNYDHPFPEQDAMNHGFGPGRIVALPPRFNYLNHLPIAHPETAAAAAAGAAAVFHFGYNKPWARAPDFGGPLPGTEDVAEPYYARWRALDAVTRQTITRMSPPSKTATIRKNTYKFRATPDDPMIQMIAVDHPALRSILETRTDEIVIKYGKPAEIQTDYAIVEALAGLPNFPKYDCMFTYDSNPFAYDAARTIGDRWLYWLYDADQESIAQPYGFIAMPYFPLGSMMHFWWDRANFAVLKSTAKQVCFALLHAFETNGTVHSNMHLSNVMLTHTAEETVTYGKHTLQTNGVYPIITDFCRGANASTREVYLREVYEDIFRVIHCTQMIGNSNLMLIIDTGAIHDLIGLGIPLTDAVYQTVSDVIDSAEIGAEMSRAPPCPV